MQKKCKTNFEKTDTSQIICMFVTFKSLGHIKVPKLTATSLAEFSPIHKLKLSGKNEEMDVVRYLKFHSKYKQNLHVSFTPFLHSLYDKITLDERMS